MAHRVPTTLPHRDTLDGSARMRVGPHFRVETLPERSQGLDIDSECAEESAASTGLLHRQTSRLPTGACLGHRAGALHRQRPASLGGLEGIEEAGGGARLGAQRAALGSEQYAGPALRPESPAHWSAIEVAPPSRAPLLVGADLLRPEGLLLHEPLAAQPGGAANPLHVAGGERGQPLTWPGLTARPPQGCRATPARNFGRGLASSAHRGEV